MNWDSYKNFSEWEFFCGCGCERQQMDSRFIALLQSIRDNIHTPMRISSGYRCPRYNRMLGGTEDGPHTTGKAADILMYGDDAYELIESAMEHYVHGIGVHQKDAHDKRFVHLDMMPTGNPRRPRPCCSDGRRGGA